MDKVPYALAAAVVQPVFEFGSTRRFVRLRALGGKPEIFENVVEPEDFREAKVFLLAEVRGSEEHGMPRRANLLAVHVDSRTCLLRLQLLRRLLHCFDFTVSVAKRAHSGDARR